MLDNYDMCACHCYSRKRNFSIPEYMKIPYAFSEINTGMVAFKKMIILKNLLNYGSIIIINIKKLLYGINLRVELLYGNLKLIYTYYH